MSDTNRRLPIEDMLRDATAAWNLHLGTHSPATDDPDFVGNLACHIRALADELERAQAEVERLKEFEWMYKELAK
jgi:hypothetical protein